MFSTFSTFSRSSNRFAALLGIMAALAAPVTGLAQTGDARATALTGHVKYLASDELGGRATGTPGFDLAAEYVAKAFRHIGLEAPVDGTFFQAFDWSRTERDHDTLKCSLRREGVAATIEPAHLRVEVDHQVAFTNATVVKVDFDGPYAALEVEAPVVVITEMPPLRQVFRDRTRAGQLMQFAQWIEEVSAVMLVVVETGSPPPVRREGGGLRRPGDDRPRRTALSFPVVRLHDTATAAWYRDEPSGPTGATLDFDMGEERTTPAIMRNVVGVLRGTDPAKADEWIVVSAHLDHIGTGTGSGDVINNGANDDASGVAGVIETAAILAADPPACSVLFITYFGEERGLLGSRAYVEAPLVPLERTRANVNLEHIGRTDDSDEPGAGQFMITGYHLSSAADAMIAAGTAAGLRHNPHDRKSRQFFGASDNASFARAGIPAHTICTAFIFPDYHAPGDHWDRLDYANMSRVVDAVSESVRRIADADQAPTWHDTRDAREYRAARDALTATGG